MLDSYLQQTQLLLNDIGEARFNLADLQTYINTARGQIAGEAECIRVYATLAVTAPTQEYPFSAIVFPAGTAGVQGVLNVRLVNYALGNGAVYVQSRQWPWFQLHNLSSQQVAAAPSVFSQFGQGASGTLWINLPDSDYSLSLDTVCYPSPLVDDNTSEALPYQWTDAVVYYAAYFALLTAQNTQGAAEMMKLYQEFMRRARGSATPSVYPMNYAQSPDPFLANRLGITPPRGNA